jgi:hypothetical protein
LIPSLSLWYFAALALACRARLIFILIRLMWIDPFPPISPFGFR